MKKRSHCLVISAVYLIVSLLMFVSAGDVSAQNTPNNKFGIHLAQPSDEDIDRAEELVNSQGGSWGYVTLVIHEDDRKIDKWQPIFDKLRERRLIPIIRLATKPNGGFWERPHSGDAEDWVVFLNELNWVVKNRYIILFNEPNHASEWGGKVDPQHFAQINEEFARKLKEAHPDYFVMMGGVDLAAPSARPSYEDAAVFLRETINEIGIDDFNTYFDGLASHSYPNPGFIGSPLATGRTSVRGYDWELSLLQAMGIKELPVFITETGWNGDALPRSQIAENFRYAYQNIWLPDKRVVAVTPFVLNYQGEPFLKFSWVQLNNIGVYPEYEAVQGMTKESGRPEIEEKGTIEFSLPREIVEKSTYHFRIELKNAGQGIWSEENGYEFILEGIPKTQYLISSLGTVKPGESRLIDIYFSTQTAIGPSETRFILNRDNEPILESGIWNYEVVPLPSLAFKALLFPKFRTNDTGFEIQIFDEYEQIVFKKKDLNIEDGNGFIDKIENIALGEQYRVVLLKQYYLPRQAYIVFNKDKNEIRFERMIPLDFDGDGALRWRDISSVFRNIKLLGMWLP